MEENWQRYLMTFIAGAFFGGVIVIWAAAEHIEEKRQEAIKAGVGRWTIEPETGKRKFIYGKE